MGLAEHAPKRRSSRGTDTAVRVASLAVTMGELIPRPKQPGPAHPTAVGNDRLKFSRRGPR